MSHHVTLKPNPRWIAATHILIPEPKPIGSPFGESGVLPAEGHEEYRAASDQDLVDQNYIPPFIIEDEDGTTTETW
jgi:hypothetical protein